MKIYNKRNNFEAEEVSDLSEIENHLTLARTKLLNLGYDDIAAAWNALGLRIIKERSLVETEGIFYLCQWLRKDNLLNFISDNLRLDFKSSSLKLKAKGHIIPQPRGIVACWIAGNTVTLPIFAIAQATLVGNSVVIRASKNNLDLTLEIMKLIDKVGTSESNALLNNISVVYFPHDNIEEHKKLSRIADCKAIWGSSETISLIKSLPEKDNCECLIFGPKYSIAVMDREVQSEKGFNEKLRGLARDIFVFDQMTCSSPQMLFVENGRKGLREIAELLSKQLEELSLKYPKRFIREDISSKIIRKRNEYMLNPELDALCSKENNWTILIGGEMRLEEAVQSRTLFLKEVNSLNDIQELINPKIQTICMIVSDRRREILARKYFDKGAARCVLPGETNEYDWPWDGMFVLDRLVRWCRLS